MGNSLPLHSTHTFDSRLEKENIQKFPFSRNLQQFQDVEGLVESPTNSG